MLSEGMKIEHKAIWDDSFQKMYLPYTCTTVNEELKKYAEVYLNETEETRVKCLKELREVLRKDGDLNFKDDENLLLCFLRSRKFDVKRAAGVIRRSYEFLDSHRNLLCRVDPQVVRRVIKSNMVGFLPYRDHKDRAIVYARADCWDPSELPADDVIFGGIVSMRSAMDNPISQIAGFVVILDLMNLRLHQVLAMTSWLIFATQALQRCCPCIVKEFHVINSPAIYKIGWQVVKPLLSEKLKNRFFFHKSSKWESLHELLPPSILPLELGGQLGPFDNDHWARDIDAIEKKYYDYVQYGYMSKKKKAAS